MKNINIEKIKQIAKKYSPKEINPILLVGVTTKAMSVFSDEYQEEMRRKHPDWYK
ncbi:hypothetical protein [Bacteroides sp.]|uniref:hypothetical protein n=1 Tax=Bacteroides sp. TaxID=29523 RepID=UPI00263626F9|nr:hypothetical protein [Bacteroides sp.]MDD3040032.1 hypothetical protein [Bacteroides sp.]